jgi:arabinofuranosyltransferase
MRSRTWARAIRTAFVGVVVLAQFIFVSRLVRDAAPGLWESRWVQDDAYISFRYARNLVDGNGLVFNPGDRVEGYTNFLWTVTAAVPLATGAADPLPAMHRTARLLWFSSYGLLLAFGAYLVSRKVYTAPLIAAPLLAHWSFNQWYLSGMETGLVSFLFLLTLMLFAVQDGKRTLLAVLFGTSCVLLLMSRPDTVVFVWGLALAMVVCNPRWLAARDFWRRWVPSFLLPVMAIYLPYTLWRLWYYGSFLPNTYYAKAVYNPAYQRGWEYLTKYFEIYDFAPLLLVPAAAALITRDQVLRRFLAGSVFGGAAVFLYVVRLGGDFMEWRFLMPITGVVFAGIGIGLYVIAYDIARWIFSRFSRTKDVQSIWLELVAITCGVVCVLFGLSFLHQAAQAGRRPARREVILGQETIPSLAKYARPEYSWGEIGRTCKQLFPADTGIATTAAGMIPYFAELPTLDLHGLTDREIARERIEPDTSRRMGHEHQLGDRNAMRERGVEVYLRWPQLWDFPRALAEPEAPGEANASIRLSNGKYFEVVFLNPDQEFVQDLRNRDGVVFKDLSRVLPDEEMVVYAPLLDTRRVIDRIDIEVGDSEEAHDFEEIFDPDAPWGHNYHDKVLAYLSSGESEVLRDEGRRIYHRATWVVRGVSADADLDMVVRHDHTASSRYRVEVNGRESPHELVFPRLLEQWGETRLMIPRELLRDGENRFVITRDRSVVGTTEIFHMWFLQEKPEGVVDRSP